ncbi:ATP-dependent RNA helicase dbp10 [Tulasnella sp. 418]|nr:ATP-dependent RNA helicase dbp10 [Tulasnella sp. 418]
MGGIKRKAPEEDHESDEELSIAPLDHSDDSDVDIFDALAGPSKKPGLTQTASDGESEEEEDDMEFIQKQMEKQNIRGGMDLLKKVEKGKLAKGVAGGGSFQSMGLHPSLLRSLLLRGYRTPTPIQRLTIPSLLASPPRDLVGMARTGSGKTLAYMIPLIQRLGGRHGTTFGARALILVPARELALQIMKVGKELARGFNNDGGEHAGDADEDEDANAPKGKGNAIRWGLVVGGESMDEQFEMIASNPDVIIATPGRLLHLIVEMNLDLRSAQYVVFDEADRLFEMGFATALHEILHRLPTTRQTLLFSATLPKNLVEFAKAGLQNPKLVRLDAESKISSDLRMAFFSVKQAEKDACLLTLIRDTIKVPLASRRIEKPQDSEKKKNSKQKTSAIQLAPHQTLIFAATKHHVEYLSTFLEASGYSVSHIYGSLDQAARTLQMDRFRRNQTDILVVTDVAARGIDIPVLENVVNYDFPQGARVFVHRVGRTARAGRQGWAWSFVTNTDLPYLLDLQLFLGRELKTTVKLNAGDAAFTESLVIGTFPRDRVDEDIEYIRGLDDMHNFLPSLREVMGKGHGLYERTKGKASQPSYARAKEMIKDGKWGLAGTPEEGGSIHPIIAIRLQTGSQSDPTAPAVTDMGKALETEKKRQDLLKAVNQFRPAETVFEIGSRGKTAGAALMKGRRRALEKAASRMTTSTQTQAEKEAESGGKETDAEVEMADEDDIEAAFGPSGSKKGRRGQNFRDSEFYMPHYQKDAITDKGYSLKDGMSFVEQARGATFDLTTDEGVTGRQRHGSQLNWDKKKKKFVKGTGEGADNVKLVKTESGARLPASYRSGRFEEWKSKTRVNLPKIGEAELPNRGGNSSYGGKVFRHKSTNEAKPLDPRMTGYERKMRQLKKKAEVEMNMNNGSSGEQRPGGKKGPVLKKNGRLAGKSMNKVKSELKSADAIRKARAIKEKRRAKNARPSKKGKGRR